LTWKIVRVSEVLAIYIDKMRRRILKRKCIVVNTKLFKLCYVIE